MIPKATAPPPAGGTEGGAEQSGGRDARVQNTTGGRGVHSGGADG